MKNKNILLSIIISLVFLIGIVSGETVNQCILNVTLVNQDPNPATPNGYVDVLFQVSGVENSNCNGAKFELVPSYPFSLDNNDTLKILGGGTWVSNSNKVWNIPFSLRVDKDALDGNSEIEVLYSAGNQNLDITKKFSILIKDSRTNFDAVIQEVSGSDVSIAIANTGKYTANSVVVRIPDQEAYRATTTNGQMVGNLASGDYTIVSFSLTKVMGQRLTQNNTNQSYFRVNNTTLQQPLKFDVYYTDSLGERRTVNMELPLNMNTNYTAGGGNFQGRMQTTSSSSSIWLKWYFWVIVLLVLIVLYVEKEKIKGVFHKKKHSNDNSNLIPDWIKNTIEKEKKK
jgi:hypothetical protein